jgi:hypothetical protein
MDMEVCAGTDATWIFQHLVPLVQFCARPLFQVLFLEVWCRFFEMLNLPVQRGAFSHWEMKDIAYHDTLNLFHVIIYSFTMNYY